MRTFVGHDPGKRGHVAWIDQAGEVLGRAPQPLTGNGKGDTYDRDGMVELVEGVPGDLVVWVIEEQQPGAGQNGATVGLQQRGYGLWLGVLAALRVPVLTVRPQAWRKHFACAVPRVPALVGATRKEQTARDRARRQAGLALAIERAQGLFPDDDLLANDRCRVPSPDVAVALLLAEYGRQIG